MNNIINHFSALFGNFSCVGTLFICLVIIALLICIRIYVILPKPNNKNLKTTQKRKVVDSLLVVIGSGGHTSEMIKLLNSLDPSKFTKIHLIVASTDKTSKKNVQLRLKPEIIQKEKLIWHTIPRSREVKQSYFTSIFSTLKAFLYTLIITLPQTNPDLIIVNGPGTCVPIVFSAYFYRFLGIRKMTKIIFVESVCRVQSLSLTGKILYYFADRFIVHWETLVTKYPRTEYLGRIC